MLFSFVCSSGVKSCPVNITTGVDNNNDGLIIDRPAGTPRNTLHGPGYLNLDLNLGHSFKLRPSEKEGPALIASLNAFNVFNHKNYSGYSGVFGPGPVPSPGFGQAHQAQPPRRMQLNLEFTF